MHLSSATGTGTADSFVLPADSTQAAAAGYVVADDLGMRSQHAELDLTQRPEHEDDAVSNGHNVALAARHGSVPRLIRRPA